MTSAFDSGYRGGADCCDLCGRSHERCRCRYNDDTRKRLAKEQAMNLYWVSVRVDNMPSDRASIYEDTAFVCDTMDERSALASIVSARPELEGHLSVELLSRYMAHYRFVEVTVGEVF